MALKPPIGRTRTDITDQACAELFSAYRPQSRQDIHKALTERQIKSAAFPETLQMLTNADAQRNIVKKFQAFDKVSTLVIDARG